MLVTEVWSYLWLELHTVNDNTNIWLFHAPIMQVSEEGCKSTPITSENTCSSTPIIFWPSDTHSQFVTPMWCFIARIFAICRCFYSLALFVRAHNKLPDWTFRLQPFDEVMHDDFCRWWRLCIDQSCTAVIVLLLSPAVEDLVFDFLCLRQESDNDIPSKWSRCEVPDTPLYFSVARTQLRFFYRCLINGLCLFVCRRSWTFVDFHFL